MSAIDIIVIVDCFSTAKQLPDLLGKELEDKKLEKDSKFLGFIHVKSSKDLPANFKHKPEDFIENIIYEEGPEAMQRLVDKLKKYNIQFCIGGSESGVELADQLAQALKLPNNDPKHSALRRDKFPMGEAVAEAGLKTVKQLKSHELKAVVDWAQEALREDPEHPVVLKPLSSASGQGVYFCKDEEEVSTAFNKIMDEKNIFGQKNTAVLAQTFNAGVEYIINTVSWGGVHFVAEIHRILKIQGTESLYDTATIVTRKDEEWNEISEYVKKVLNAVHIQYGPGTTEIKYTPKGGPVLIETGSRPMQGVSREQLAFLHKVSEGSAIPRSLVGEDTPTPRAISSPLEGEGARRADGGGYSQLSLMAKAYANPQKFLAWVKAFEENPPQSNQHAMAVILISNVEGILATDLDMIEITALKSVYSYSIGVKKDDKIQKTVDAMTAPGEIYLMNANKEKLLADCKRIREIEETWYKKALLQQPSPKPVVEPVKRESWGSYFYKRAYEHRVGIALGAGVAVAAAAAAVGFFASRNKGSGSVPQQRSLLSPLAGALLNK